MIHEKFNSVAIKDSVLQVIRTCIVGEVYVFYEDRDLHIVVTTPYDFGYIQTVKDIESKWNDGLTVDDITKDFIWYYKNYILKKFLYKNALTKIN